MHIIVFTLTIEGTKDAPLVVPFLSPPTLLQLSSGIQAIDKSAPADAIVAKLMKAGLTDKTMQITCINLAAARAQGEWPTIEYRMEDGSLMSFQMLTVFEPGTTAAMHLLRRKNRAKPNGA